eukprot:COSAG06_NODE_15773_length_1045_cov_2.364693_1_plen_145_part_01
MERLRSVAVQVLESGNRGGNDDFASMEALAAISPVATCKDAGSWGTPPAAKAQELLRRSARWSYGASVLLRRSLSLWRSVARSGSVSRHATAQRLLQEQLQKKDDELRVTVGALERAVTVSQQQLALSRSGFEEKLQAISAERDA